VKLCPNGGGDLGIKPLSKPSDESECDFLTLGANNGVKGNFRLYKIKNRMTNPDFQEAFQNRIEQHKKILYKVCNAYCRDRDAREDLAQEITLQLWRSFGKFDGRCQFSTWMYRIALNAAISFYRTEGTRTRHVISDEQRLLTAESEIERQPEEVRLLYELIEELDPLSRALILLYLDGNTYPEIADIVGITETNVATKISRLKSKMKQEFGTKKG
jgi:RNA polymerase sigma factor (sigma-70 family)